VAAAGWSDVLAALGHMNRQFLFGVIATIATVLIIVLGIEGAVRFLVDDGMQFDLEMWKYAKDVKRVSADPLVAHEHAPNRQALLMGVDFAINSKGLRDREFSYERTPGLLRIMMLGDSLTVGWGVPVEDTFSKRLERMYAERGIEAEVLNTGVGNYNTIQEVQYFLNEGRKYKPDIVVLNFFVNDAEPVPREAPPSWFARACHSCAFVAGRIDTVRRKFFDQKNWTDYYLGLYGNGSGKGWLDAKQAIARLTDYGKENGIKLLIANLPELHQLKNYPFQPITGLVRQAADENGVGFVDLLPYLQEQEPARLWVTPPDPHPNAYANKFIAQGLFEALQKL
jgi:lysophospholipase L1-like esterase